MFSESAELYDAIYAATKDYAREAGDIAALLLRVHPGCRSVLDVGCGTGEHARRLAAEHRYLVDGLDLDPAFVRIARAKHPAGRFHQGDMADFHLGRRYDALLCLFSSIGYVRTLEAVQGTLGRFREHLAEGGVVIVEPWFPPGALEPGKKYTRTVEVGGRRVVRTGSTTVEGRLSRVRFDYEIHEAGGVRRATEVHELGLFTTEEMLLCFEEAGLAAKHEYPGLTDRGLFIARAAAGA